MNEGTSEAAAFIWRPFISFEDTNLVGNVYFAKFVSWQGRCREAFLAEHAPDVLSLLRADLRLVTLKVSCEFYEELAAFDALEIEMRLIGQRAHRIELGFDYILCGDGTRNLAARGQQEVACMQLAQGDAGLLPAEIPASLYRALRIHV